MALPHWLHIALIVVCTVNAVSSVAAVTLNGLIMFTIRKSPSLQKPAFVLLFALALNDFMTGFVVQPLFIWRMIERTGTGKLLKSIWVDKMEIVIRLSSITITVLLHTAVSFDRFLALHLKTRYRSIVTIKRSVAVCLLLWIGGTGTTVVGVLIKNGSFTKLFLIFLPISLLLTSTLFIANSRTLARQQKKVCDTCNEQFNSSGNKENQTRLDLARYSKILSSLKYAFGAFVVFYLPIVFVVVANSIFPPRYRGAFLIGKLANTITLTNSAVNPLLYYWKVPGMRLEFKRIFNRF